MTLNSGNQSYDEGEHPPTSGSSDIKQADVTEDELFESSISYENRIRNESNTSGIRQEDEANSSLLDTHEGIAGSSQSHASSSDLELQIALPLSTKQRIINVFHRLVPIKQTYERLNNGINSGRMHTNAPGRFIGLGTDGVFRNLAAKPEADSEIQAQEVTPPTYEDASADNAPEYWESTVVSPMYGDEVFVDGLPVGSFVNYVWIALVTVAFQFLGFVLCYLLHTSHAGKHGARAGLGITFIIYAYGMIPTNFGHVDKLPDRIQVVDANDYEILQNAKITGDIDTYKSDLFQQGVAPETILNGYSSPPYFAYGVIAFGLFLLLKALTDFYRIKAMERDVLAPPHSTEVVTSTTEMTESPNLDNT